jgi:hypothetical protein
VFFFFISAWLVMFVEMLTFYTVVAISMGK